MLPDHVILIVGVASGWKIFGRFTPATPLIAVDWSCSSSTTRRSSTATFPSRYSTCDRRSSGWFVCDSIVKRTGSWVVDINAMYIHVAKFPVFLDWGKAACTASDTVRKFQEEVGNCDTRSCSKSENFTRALTVPFLQILHLVGFHA